MGDKVTAYIGKPFSANKMYAPMKAGGMCKTRAYNAWIKLNTSKVVKQLKPIAQFPVSVQVTIMGGADWNSKTQSGHKDLDNTHKPIVDLLVKSQIIPDDSHEYIDRIQSKFMPFKHGVTQTVIEIEIPEEALGAWAPAGYKIDDNGLIVPICEISVTQESSDEIRSSD